MASEAVVQIDLQGKLQKLASGKVRDLFVVDDATLLFVASDRISAYDVVMENGIPGKGALLTAMSLYWFRYLSSKIPSLQTHILDRSVSDSLSSLPASLLDTIRPRSMLVRRLRVLPLESIVRGYITGSAWSSYKKDGTVNGITLEKGLKDGQKLSQPLWTPSTKAEAGEHDENISPEQAKEIVGEDYAAQIEKLSLQIYETAAQRAEEVGIILADTKFEFGVDEQGNVVLIDEVLTPDSSRFWPKDSWAKHVEAGKAQESFDKQFLRNWLTDNKLKGKEGVKVPEDVVQQTAEKYREAYERLTGETLKGV